MKNLTITCALICLSFILKGQDLITTYRDFIPKDYELKQSSLYLSSNNIVFNQRISTYDNKDFDFGVSGALNLFKTNYTQKKEVSRYVNIEGNGFIGRNKKNDDLITKLFFDSRLGYGKTTRNYYKPNKFWGLDFSGDLESRINKQSGYLDSKLITGDLSLRPSLTYGFGRIYDVSSFHQAHNFFKELKKAGLLVRDFTGEDITKIADAIQQNRYTRYFDSRDGRMENISKLDSVFMENGYIDDASVKYFNILHDMYHYGFESRKSGIRHTFSLNTILSSDIGSEEQNNSRDIIRNFFGELALGYNYNNERPLSEKWQRSTNGGASLGFRYINRNDLGTHPSVIDKFPVAKLDFNHGYSYFPNTRTELKSNVFFEGLGTWEDDNRLFYVL